MINFIIQNWNMIIKLTSQHIEITSITMIIAMLLGLPLGYFLSFYKGLGRVLVTILSLVYTIPSLAFFVLLIPFFGLGIIPAIIALTAYTLFVIVSNTILGYQQVNESILETARSLGYGKFAVFFKFHTLNALPTIISGIRIATTSTIGIATIASYINAGGLGTMIFDGLNQNNYIEVIVGSIIISIIAILVNWMLEKVQTLVLKYIKGEL